jgi:hypothetical protein
LRLAQHRREGWQMLAAFQVTAKAAIAIETDILRWWRAELALPSYLKRDQMPAGRMDRDRRGRAASTWRQR